MAKNSIEDVRMVQYDDKNEPIPGELPNLQLIGSTFVASVPEGVHTYLEGTFGLAGDWVIGPLTIFELLT